MNNTTGVTERASSRSMAPFFIIWTGQAFSLVGSSLVQAQPFAGMISSKEPTMPHLLCWSLVD
jgi:hypothetical protein